MQLLHSPPRRDRPSVVSTHGRRSSSSAPSPTQCRLFNVRRRACTASTPSFTAPHIFELPVLTEIEKVCFGHPNREADCMNWINRIRLAWLGLIQLCVILGCFLLANSSSQWLRLERLVQRCNRANVVQRHYSSSL